MQRIRRRFRTEQIGGPNLDAGGAERQGGRDTPRIGDAASRNHRDVHRLHDLSNQRECADLGS